MLPEADLGIFYVLQTAEECALPCNEFASLQATSLRLRSTPAHASITCASQYRQYCSYVVQLSRKSGALGLEYSNAPAQAHIVRRSRPAPSVGANNPSQHNALPT